MLMRQQTAHFYKGFPKAPSSELHLINNKRVTWILVGTCTQIEILT